VAKKMYEELRRRLIKMYATLADAAVNAREHFLVLEVLTF
jgi:hypothetical protein